jgi:hypothetical protein
VLCWVPTKEIAAALADLPEVITEVVVPDGGPLPPGARDVEFHVPPFFPPLPAITAIAQMPSLRVVQAQTAGGGKVAAPPPAGSDVVQRPRRPRHFHGRMGGRRDPGRGP